MKIAYSILLLVFCIIILSEITGIYILRDFKNTLENNITEHAEQLNSVMVNRIDSYVTERLVDTINFASDATIKTAIETSNMQFSKMQDPAQYVDKMDKEWASVPKQEITPFMKTLIDSETSMQLREISNTENTLFNDSVYGEIFVTNSYGANVAETDKTSDYKQNDETWWQEAKKNGIYLGGIEFDNSSKDISFPVAMRIDDVNGNFLGVVKSVVNIEHIINIIKAQMSSVTTMPSEYELVKKDGTILYSTNVEEKTFTKNTESEFMDKLIGNFGNFTYDDPDTGKTYLVTYSHSTSPKIAPIFDWIFITKFDKAELLKPVNNLVNNTLILVLTFITIVSIVVFIISTRLVKPIETIQKGIAERIKGKSPEIKIDGADEFKDLSENFNEMIKKMDENKNKILKSEIRYKTLFDLSPAMIGVTDEKLNIISANSKFLDVLGYTLDDIIGKPAANTVTGRSLAKFEKIASGIEKQQYNEAIWLKNKNGDEIPVIVNATRIYDENQKFQGLIGMMIDATEIYEYQKERDLSEVKLQNSKNMYKGLFESNPEPIRISGLDLVTVDANNSFLRKFGYSKDEIVGKSIYVNIDDESRRTVDKILDELRNGGSVENREVFYQRKDGTRIPISLSVSLSRDQAGNPSGYIAVMADISEIYEAKKKIQEDEEKIRYQLQKLKQIDELKDQFSAMISHELTTPLFPIKFHAEMLKDPTIHGKLNKEQMKSINDIYENAVQLERLIGDILDAQKLEHGKIKFNKVNFELDEFIKKIENLSVSLIPNKSIKLENTAKEKITVNSDPDRLEQVFTNLIRNSSDFVSEKTGKIEIGAEVREKDILFHVKDNGVGIPKEKQVELFKKFYQIDTTLTRKHNGSGLGLSICKGIVEGLGGKIWLESTEGVGTVVYFTIPKGETN